MKKYRNLITTLLIVVLVFASTRILHLHEKINLEFIRSLFEQNSILATVIFILLFAASNLLYIPGVVFLAGAVLTLGKIHGAFITYVAAVTSAAISYFLIGRLSKNMIRELDNPFAKRILARIDERPLKSNIILRLIFQTSPALNYALSMCRLKFSDYILGIIIGLPVPIAIYCILFDFLFHS